MKTLLTRLAILVGLVRGLEERRAPGAARPRLQDDGVDPREYETGGPPWAEPVVAGLLLVAALLFVAFAVLLALDRDTQLLGGTLGGGLAALAAAMIVASKGVVPRETAVEDRPLGEPRVDQIAVEHDIGKALDGVSRRGLLAAAAGTAGVGALAAAALPITALGPSPSALNEAPWRAGKRLVDEDGRPIPDAIVVPGTIVTAFQEGADPRELGSPIVVLRVPPATLHLPPNRQGWAPGGLLAYSKICTHAGCAVSLYRTPLYEPLSSSPALVCPCHYSTFDVRRAAKVIFGPASRPLPQLPLRVDGDGHLVADGPLSGSVGPEWWGTEGRHA